jgi:subtilisin family serine protease|tara:strand:- start:6423 stop:7343 length:921 start_codon:yes stop_codon:yes gene_type:complete
MFFRKKNAKLLPHIREDIHGYNAQAGQVLGWEIKKLHINHHWTLTEGEGVKVAVIDTGCDLDHDDLKHNLLPGKNFISENKQPRDDNGHGTHVAGTIAATNNGVGMVGVAPKTKIVPIKALDKKGGGSTQVIARAVEWAVDQRVDFITMSLGSGHMDPNLQQAINYAEAMGVVVFCAAGNSGPNVDIMYPAKFNNTISIGAIDNKFNRTRFSCSGESLDFMAPGLNIFSTVPNNRYAIMSGTSMSNPFATGCASLLLSYNKKHKKYNLTTYQDYVNFFKRHTIQISNPAHRTKRYQGYGIMNLKLV